MMKANDRRRLISLLLSILLLFSFIGCDNRLPKPQEYNSFLFDTFITIKLWCNGDANDILNGAAELCLRYDSMFDRNDPDSDIGRLNRSGGQPCKVSQETAEIITYALEYAEFSGGLFDITCGRVTSLWDFSSDSPSLPTREQLDAALATVGWQNVSVDGCTITLPPGTELDLGGIAKGYIADRVIEYLKQQKVENAVVNLGGNVKVLGDKNGQLFSVGIQSPFEQSGYAGTLNVSDCSVVTAGAYQRCFELNGSRYHHILDLSSGMPANSGLASVSVLADSSAQADALATMCFLLGVDDGMNLISSIDSAQAVFITEDGQTITSDGLKGVFFPD